MSTQSRPVPAPSDEGVIRCPAVRSLVKSGDLKHERFRIAAVQELVRTLSGQNRELGPAEPGSLANVAGFFAIFNHSAAHLTGIEKGFIRRIVAFVRGIFHRNSEAALVAAGKSTRHLFSLELFGSPGHHPGTVNFYKNDRTGAFDEGQFAAVMADVANGDVLTVNGIAKMIIQANEGAWDEKGSIIDLAKSSGEWALAVCALRANPQTTDISVADLREMYRARDSTKLLAGTRRETARNWAQVTAQIAQAIAGEKGDDVTLLSGAIHTVFRYMDGEVADNLCPCRRCNGELWAKG